MCCLQREGYPAADRGRAGAEVPAGEQPSSRGVKGSDGVSLSSHSGGDQVLLPTARVQVLGNDGKPVSAKLIMDSGSDRSFVSERLLRKVKGTWKGSVEMTYAAFGGGKRDGVYDKFELQLTASNVSLPSVHRIEAVRVPVICAPLRRPQVPAQLLETFSHLPLADSFSDDQDQLIDILVGQDQYWDLVRAGLFRSSEGLVAQETVFGWVLSGKAEGPPGGPLGRGVSLCQLLTMTDVPAGRNLWSLGSSELGDTLEHDVEDDVEPDVLQEFKESVSYDDGRYVVKLPWKSDGSVSKLMDNRDAAESRLASLTRKLDRDPVLKEKYDSVLTEMEASGVICEVPSEELCSEFPTYYMPHRPVVKQSSSGIKVRPVFDASARGYNGVSLNDCVEAGPAMIPSLPDVLLRFRR